MTQEPDQTILRYLLGELSEAEQERFEDEYFADSQLFQRLQDARNDLMDGYVREELPAAQRARFEQYFLASLRRRERVDLAREFARHEARTAIAEEPQKLPLFGWFTLRLRLATALLLVVLGCGGIWWLWSRRQSAPTIANHTAATPTATINPSPTPAASLPPATPIHSPFPLQPKPVIATFTLSPVLVRDNDETQLLTIAPQTEVVRLLLQLEPRRKGRYQARLHTPEGKQIFRAHQLAAQPTANGQQIVLSIAARLLREADYIAQLDGVTAAGGTVDRYYFRVAKK